MIGPVWWFYTVILGVAFGQILIDMSGVIRARRVTPDATAYLPAMVWQVFLLVLIVQVWIAVSYYRLNVETATILRLAAFLAVPAGIFVMTFLLPKSVPQGEIDEGKVLSAQAQFDRVRPLFFGVLIAFVVINVLHGLLEGELALDVDLLFQSLFVAGGVIGMFLRGRTADLVLAIAMVVLLCTYIGLEYSVVSTKP